MLYTNLQHIESAAEHARNVTAIENVVVICGRMNPQCVSVYRIAEALEDAFKNVKFFDMEFDNPESQVIRSLPGVTGFSGIPFTVYYKNGSVVNVTSGLQLKEDMIGLLNEFMH
jgi:thioredoxin 1